MEGLPFELLSGSLEAEFQASTNLVLAIGIQLAGIFGYEAGFKLKLPRLKRTYTTITKEDNTQACPGSKHETLVNSTTGILEKNEINLDLIALVGEDRAINAKALETTLFVCCSSHSKSRTYALIHHGTEHQNPFPGSMPPYRR